MWKSLRLRMDLVTVGLGLLLGGVLLLQFGRTLVYLLLGVSTPATVTEVNVRLESAGDEFGRPWLREHIRYSYHDGDGVQYTGEVARTVQTPAGYRVGQTLTVEYLRVAPASSQLVVADTGEAGWALLLLVLLIGASIILLVRWLKHSDRFLWLLARLAALSRFSPFKHRRRARLVAGPFPAAWKKYLDRVKLYQFLTPDEQARLQDDLRIFIAEKDWEGCAGLAITDEMKVIIAAQACMLLLGMKDHDYYPHVPSVLVYPTTFETREHRGHDGLVSEKVELLGQAWYRGPVVLAWDEVKLGGKKHRDGHNVVYHEFAHQVDFLGDFRDSEQLRTWSEVMTAEYQQLVDDSEQGRATLLDDYGAVDEHEFFAVATECFLEKPIEMEQRHPRLYEVLRDYYGQDPATRFRRRPAGRV